MKHGGTIAGFACPRCGFDGECVIERWRPIPGVQFELECGHCFNRWWTT